MRNRTQISTPQSPTKNFQTTIITTKTKQKEPKGGNLSQIHQQPIFRNIESSKKTKHPSQTSPPKTQNSYQIIIKTEVFQTTKEQNPCSKHQQEVNSTARINNCTVSTSNQLRVGQIPTFTEESHSKQS